MADVNINVPLQAKYGRNDNGSIAARDEWWNGMQRNDGDQSTIAQGIGIANGGAAPRENASEDPALAKNVAGGANGHQGGAIGLAGSLASGSQPSPAAYQLQNGLNAARAQQQSVGRSARGAGAIANAGANAQANVASLQQNAYTQGGLLRSRDMATGRGLLGTQLGQQRDQDNARIGMANDMSQFNADAQNKYSLGMGQAGVALGQVGNAQAGQDFSYYENGMHPVDAQSEADQQHQRWWADAEKRKVAANTENG